MNSETPSLSLDEYASKARLRMTIHAEKAIEILEYQLVTAKSPARIARLNSRISEYKTVLQTLRKQDDTKSDLTAE